MILDVFHAGIGVAEICCSDQGLQFFALAFLPLLVDQHAKAILKGERIKRLIITLSLKGFCHGRKAEIMQLIDGGLADHERSPPLK